VKKILAGAAAVVMATLPLAAGPAIASSKPPLVPSVEILTHRATAFGDVYYDDYAHEWRVNKPHFRIRMRALCPEGQPAWIIVPVHSMTKPGQDFVCTGHRQVVTFGYAYASDRFGWNLTPTTVTLRYEDQTPIATDSETIRVFTSRRDLYP
jgi:hypothetical protein